MSPVSACKYAHTCTPACTRRVRRERRSARGDGTRCCACTVCAAGRPNSVSFNVTSPDIAYPRSSPAYFCFLSQKTDSIRKSKFEPPPPPPGRNRGRRWNRRNRCSVALSLVDSLARFREIDAREQTIGGIVSWMTSSLKNAPLRI